MAFRRKPNPFTVCFIPNDWEATAKLDGKPVDLVQAFQTKGWSDLSRIEVSANGRQLFPWRDGDPFEQVPYKGEGAGYLSRDELLDGYGLTDAELEAKIAAKLHIRVELAGGEDSAEKRFFRAAGIEALTRVLDDQT